MSRKINHTRSITISKLQKTVTPTNEIKITEIVKTLKDKINCGIDGLSNEFV